MSDTHDFKFEAYGKMGNTLICDADWFSKGAGRATK